MNKSTPRQKYLYLAARLYELAAEFTDADLRTIADSFVRKDEPGIAKAIEALMLLHGVAPESPQRVVHEPKSNSKTLYSWNKKISQEPWSGQALEDLLRDETLFPRVYDIARLIPGELAPQQKEGRSRYIRRAVKYVANLDETQKIKFGENLALELKRKPHSFLSQWKNLIKEL